MLLARCWNAYVDFILSWPKAVLLFFAAITLFALFSVQSIQLDASADSLILDTDPALKSYRETRDQFDSSDEFLVLTFKASKQNLFDPQSLAALAQLQKKLEAISGVEKINSILTVPLLNHPDITLTNITEKTRYLLDSGVDLNQAQQFFKTQPLYRSLLISEDGQTTLLQILLKPSVEYDQAVQKRQALRDIKQQNSLSPEQAQTLKSLEKQVKQLNHEKLEHQAQVIESIRQVLRDFQANSTYETSLDNAKPTQVHLQLFLGGLPLIVADMLDFVRHDLALFGSLMLLFLVVSMLYLFRRFQWVWVPLLFCALGTGYLVALVGWLDLPITVISSNFMSLMLMTSLSIAVFLIERYREETQIVGQSQKQMVKNMLSHLALPTLYTVLTNMAGFASLIFSGIQPVIDFGWIMTVGSVVALLLALSFFPALLMVLKPKQEVIQQDGLMSFNLHLAHWTQKNTKMLWVLFLGSTVFFLAGISQVRVDNKFLDYFDPKTEIYQGLYTIDSELGGSTPFDLVLTYPELIQDSAVSTTSDEDCFLEDTCDESAGSKTVFTLERMEQLKKLQSFLEAQPEMGKVLSIVNTLETAEAMKKAPLDALELAFLSKMFPDHLRGLLLDPYLDEAKGQIRFSLRVKESYEGITRQELLQKIEVYLQKELGFKKENYLLTGVAVLYNNMLSSLFDSQIKTISLTALGVFIMLWLLFLSFKRAWIALVPNLIPSLAVLGMMGWMGIPLDFMTITIAAVSLGLSINNAVYYVYRYGEEWQKDHDDWQAMFRSHESVGRPIYFSTFMVMIGFSVLVLSSFKPTYYFGLFTSLALLAAMIASLTLLPYLLIRFKAFYPKVK
jgi:predicted RND superfamily exporter protein